MLYQELLNLADCILESRPLQFNQKMLYGGDQASVSLTIKNYEMEKGLSTKIHDTTFDQEKGANGYSASRANELISTENAFFIKGPMGRGL